MKKSEKAWLTLSKVRRSVNGNAWAILDKGGMEKEESWLWISKLLCHTQHDFAPSIMMPFKHKR